MSSAKTPSIGTPPIEKRSQPIAIPAPSNVGKRIIIQLGDSKPVYGFSVPIGDGETPMKRFFREKEEAKIKEKEAAKKEQNTGNSLG